MQREYSSSLEGAPIAPSQINSGVGGPPSRFIPALLWLCLLGWVFRQTVFIRGRLDFATVDVYAGIQILLVIIVFITVLLSTRFFSMWSKIAGTSVRILFIYYLICALSSIWSSLPVFTLYRAAEFMILLMGTLVALSYSPNFLKAERRVLLVSILAIIMNMYMSVYFYGFTWILKAWHTNSYSASAAIVFCYCLGEYFCSDRKRKKLLKWAGIFAFCTLGLGTSSASYIAALIGVVFVAIFHRNTALLLISSFMLLLLFVLNFVVTIDFSTVISILFPGKTAYDISTLSGRTLMWERLFYYVQTSPIIGHGFDVIATARGQLFKTSPHNSLFSILLGTGLLGLLTALFYGYRLFREFFRTTRRHLPGAVGCGAGICTGLANSLSMPLVFDEWLKTSLVFSCITSLLILFVVLPDRQQKGTDRQPKGIRKVGRRYGNIGNTRNRFS